MTSSQQQGTKQRARLEGRIEALQHIKTALCVRELTANGRRYIDKKIGEYKNELNRSQNSNGGSSR